LFSTQLNLQPKKTAFLKDVIWVVVIAKSENFKRKKGFFTA
jgi:hypothetical protein